MKSSFKQTYGYPIWYPWAFFGLMLTCIGSFIAALATMGISGWLVLLFLLIAGVCYCFIAR